MQHTWTAGFLACLLGTSPLLGAEPAELQLHTDAQLTDIHPQTDSLAFRVAITKADGSPVDSARLRIRVQAPPTPWLASTDFPVVEGTALIDSQVDADRGEFHFAFVPPIRGVYTVSIDAEPHAGDSTFAKSQQQWQKEIYENPSKQRNLAVLLLILVAVGGISGFVLGRGEAIPQKTHSIPAGLMLSLLLAFCCNKAWAHSNHPKNPADAQTQPASKPDTDNQGGRVALKLLTIEPRVGELASLEARFIDVLGSLAAARFQLRFIQIEYQQEVFSTEVTARDGIMKWQGQFYDGSAHRIEVKAVPIHETFAVGKPAYAEQQVNVQGVAPPLRAVVKSLGFLLSVTAFAMLLGILLGRFWRRKADVVF